ncbi:MAG: glycosyltransferase [Pseudomonadota bacterium]
MRIPSRLLLDFARGIIADELRMLAPRLRDLDQRLEPTSRGYANVQRSKQRPSFELGVIEVPPPRRPRPAARLASALAPTGQEATIQPLRTTAGAWLAAQLGAQARIAFVGPAADASVAALAGDPDIASFSLRYGSGVPTPSRSRLPKRERPGPGSLAAWLTTADIGEPRTIGAYVLGADATDHDVALLRFVVTGKQSVLAPRDSAAAKALLTLWSGEVRQAGPTLIFTRPGRSFIDPAELTDALVDPSAWPRITVVTVSYNQGQFLERCLRSVLDQSYPNLEYIVIDAVSNDGSQEILRRYEPRLDKLVIEPDEGQSDGLNKGFAHATGEILTWVNSDDELVPGSLRRAAAAFALYDTDLIAGGCERIGTESEHIYRRFAALPLLERLPLGFAHQYAWHRSWEKRDHFFQPEVLFTADIWRRSGGHLKRHLYWAMDWELWLRMAMAGATVVNIPVAIGCSRAQPDQKTTSEALHLHQVNNILLEHDEALEMVDAMTNGGRPSKRSIASGPGGATTQTPQGRKGGSAIKSQGEPGKRGLLRRLARSALARLEQRGPVRIVRAPLYNGLLAAREERDLYRTLLASEEPPHPTVSPARLAAGARAPEPTTRGSPSVAGRVADHLMQLLFDQDADEATKAHVAAMLDGGADLKAIARDLAARNPPLHGRPAFAARRSLLVHANPLPFGDHLRRIAGPIRIVDVGAEVLSYEDHVYAPLVRSWPTVTLGFDPFCEEPAQHEPPTVSTAGERKVTILPKFIGSGRQATFHVNKDRATSSLLEANMPLAERFYLDKYLECVETREVETTTLDTAVGLVPELAESVDFLKIDVQGGSLEVLEGGRETLERTLVCHLEAEFVELYKGEALFAEIDSFMRGCGFQLLDLIPFGRLRYKAIAPSPTRYLNGGRLLFADCIYVRQLDSLEKLENASLVKLAVIAHELYQKYDVAAEALRAYEEATGEQISKAYAQAIT